MPESIDHLQREYILKTQLAQQAWIPYEARLRGNEIPPGGASQEWTPADKATQAAYHDALAAAQRAQDRWQKALGEA